MNQIKLQNLTPDIYYNQSRDFQFIGRLFDAVLNSAKLNAEELYNLPLNEYTDEKLIDLMTLTLGFKSKHNYNVKQLAALCSAFTTVIKNKGNIQSIILATRSLLNAEGITDDVYCKISDDNTTITIFISQNLTDINLLKDLLNYILPAGTSCNIIRSTRKELDAATSVINNGTKVSYYLIEGIDSHKKPDETYIVPQISESLANPIVADTPGLIANSMILQIDEPTKENK